MQALEQHEAFLRTLSDRCLRSFALYESLARMQPTPAPPPSTGLQPTQPNQAYMPSALSAAPVTVPGYPAAGLGSPVYAAPQSLTQQQQQQQQQHPLSPQFTVPSSATMAQPPS